jgi:pimeloyl-ACP methyl ester carboxylesterase
VVATAEQSQTLQAVADELGLEVPASIQSLLARSRRVTTALGEQADAGRMVWHGWEPAAGVARQAVPLVLLHGGSGSWTHWLRMIEPLTQAGYSLWIADLPGFGESDSVPGGTDVDTMIAPLARGVGQLLAQHGRSPVCDLIGFSFGGMAAGLLAAQFPEHIRRLVLVGAPALGITEGRVVRLKGWRHLQGLPAQMQAHHHNLAELMLHDASRIDEETLVLHALNVARDRLPRRRLSRTDILAQALPQVKASVAAIYGEFDPLYIGRMDELQAVLQRSHAAGVNWQMLSGLGHWVQHEGPEATTAALLEVLA